MTVPFFFSLITCYPASIPSKVLTSSCHPKSFIASEIIEGARCSDDSHHPESQVLSSTFLQNEDGGSLRGKVSNACTSSTAQSSYKYESETFPPFFETREFDVDAILQLHDDGAGATHLRIDWRNWSKCDFENCCCLTFFWNVWVVLL